MVVPQEKFPERFSVPYFHEVTATVPQLLSDLLLSNAESSSNTACIIAKERIERKETAAKLAPAIVTNRKTLNKPKSRSDELNLTGSPLRCSFALDDDDDDLDISGVEIFAPKRSDQGPSYVPIPLRDARKCLNVYTMTSQDMKKGCIPCWAVCDGADGFLFAGAQRIDGGLALHQVKCTGPHDRKDDVLKMECFLKKHHDCVAPNGSDVQTRSIARAVYDLSEQLGGVTEDLHENDSTASTLKVLLTWIRPRTFLERPPVQATTEVHMEICQGDKRLGSFKQLSELQILKGFAGGLLNRSIVWRQQMPNEKTIKEEMNDFLNLLKHAGPRLPEANKKDKDDSNCEERVVIEDRTDLDFSDQLWNCLIKVQSYAQLSNAIALIVKTIQASELRPFIYPKNMTKIVKIVQDVIRGSDENPEIGGQLPLQILVEIGMEKLQRDHVHSLLSSYLASREDLAPFLTLDHLANVEHSLSNLTKLQVVQDIISLSQANLSPTQDCLRSIVQQSLKFLKTFELSNVDDLASVKFVCPVSNVHVKDQLAKTNPSIWQYHVESKSPDLEVTTTAHLTLEPPSEFISAKIDAVDESTDVLDLSYFCTVASSVTRLGF